MITRRGFLRFLKRMSVFGAAAGAYGFVVEPGFFLRTKVYALTPPRWTPGLKLRVVILADPHVAEPQMPLTRWREIIRIANRLEGDLILLLGDYVTHHRFTTGLVPVAEVAEASRSLVAPLGVYAITGNHDWWDDDDAQKRGGGPILTQRILEEKGIPVLENRALRLEKDGRPFWISGTSSSVAIKRGRGLFESRADLAGTLGQITGEAPVLHLAHEPDLFVEIPARVSLTLSGHTHGGQVRLFGWSPITPSQFGNRFAYGHIVEQGRHLIVSGGLGCSVLPVRFGMPPEITVVDLG